MRRGLTLIELLCVLAIIGLATGVAIPRFVDLRDRLAVHGATTTLMQSLADARHAAQRWDRVTAFTADTSRRVVAVRAGRDTVDQLQLGDLFGVTLRTTRDSIAYYPTGIGYGAANSTFVLSRGSAAETVTVSRAGRVHR
jgi:prepilin-type N-terminal cleavage/methylation domain-containing protein